MGALSVIQWCAAPGPVACRRVVDGEPATKRRFSRDLLNLTLASPSVNRYQKGAVAVRQAYQLMIDRREADAIDRILNGCPSTGPASRGLD